MVNSRRNQKRINEKKKPCETPELNNSRLRDSRKRGPTLYPAKPQKLWNTRLDTNLLWYHYSDLSGRYFRWLLRGPVPQPSTTQAHSFNAHSICSFPDLAFLALNCTVGFFNTPRRLDTHRDQRNFEAIFLGICLG